MDTQQGIKITILCNVSLGVINVFFNNAKIRGNNTQFRI